MLVGEQKQGVSTKSQQISDQKALNLPQNTIQKEDQNNSALKNHQNSASRPKSPNSHPNVIQEHDLNHSLQKEEENKPLQKIEIISLKSNSHLLRKYKERSKQENSDVKSSFISTNSILGKTNKQSKEITDQNQDNEILGLRQENQKLKNKTIFLMKQLKIIQSRLNKQLMKRGNQVSKNSFRVHSVESISNKEIQNADKRCKIYKKQIETLKQKHSIFNQQRINQLSERLKFLQQTNSNLQIDRKQLKKNNKHFEKLIEQMGDGDYLKIKQESQKLKSQNRKLKQKIKKQEQQQRMQKITVSNEKMKSKKEQQKKQQHQKKEEEKDQKQVYILKSKSERDDKKIKQLIFQNNKNKEIMEQNKKDLQDKNKEIQTLKEKLKSMKIINTKLEKDLKEKQNIDKSEDKQQQKSPKNNLKPRRTTGKQQGIKNQQTSQIGNRETSPLVEQDSTSKTKYSSRKLSEKKKEKDGQISNLKSIINKQQPIIQSKDQPKTDNRKQKYPRKLEAGQASESSFKWNHFSFSSKVKAVQVMPHANGHIKSLNFRYEKGDAGRVDSGVHAIFACEQNGEYIKQVSGGFKAGILQYINLKTDKKRSAIFCKHEIADQCDNFSLKAGENEYISAFFGQNLNESVIRFGCFIQVLLDSQK